MLHNRKHEKNQNSIESGDFSDVLKQLFRATKLIFIRLVAKL